MNPLNYTGMQMMKAFVGAILAGLTAAITAYPDGITGLEWLTIAVSVVVTFGAVFGVPNQPGSSPT